MRPCVFAKPLIANFSSGSNTLPVLVAQPDKRLASRNQKEQMQSVVGQMQSVWFMCMNKSRTATFPFTEDSGAVYFNVKLVNCSFISNSDIPPQVCADLCFVVSSLISQPFYMRFCNGVEENLQNPFVTNVGYFITEACITNSITL